METLYERIQTLCKSKGVSGSRMCLDLGLSKSTMTDLKKGRTKGVSTNTAQKIASYFGISVDNLLGEDKNEKPVTADELSENVQALVEFVKRVPDHKAEKILQAMRLILEDD